MKKKVAVLVSGGGTNLQALIDYQLEKGEACPYEIVVVISDHKDAFALERAAKAGIPSAVTSPYSVMGKEVAQAASRDEKRLAVSNAMLAVCREHKAEIIVEAGCLTVLAGEILTEYSNKIINLHPALLPKYGGVGMWGHHVHEAVKAAGETETGMTVHWVTPVCDAGEIIAQYKVALSPDDTIDDIAEKEHQLEMEYFPKVVEQVLNDL